MPTTCGPHVTIVTLQGISHSVGSMLVLPFRRETCRVAAAGTNKRIPPPRPPASDSKRAERTHMQALWSKWANITKWAKKRKAVILPTMFKNRTQQITANLGLGARRLAEI